MRYAVVTPARDEAEHLPVLARCLAGQTLLPELWVIVENGSSDGTAEVAEALAREHRWARVVRTAENPSGGRGGAVVRAFRAGLEALPGPFDVLLKVDADVSLEPGYIERLLAAFEADPALGMASGTCYDAPDGAWRERHVTGDHVWGAARAYRWRCLEDVLPLEEWMGWDGIDAIKAATRGWRTRTLPDLPFRHHRLEGERDGSRRRAWAAQGSAARYMGYRLPYLVLRTLHRMRREPAAVMILQGYAAAARRRDPRCADELVRAHVRRQQSLRRVPLRVREALGRRSVG